MALHTENVVVRLALAESFARSRADFPQMFEALGADLVNRIKQGMQREQSPSGEAWAALKPSTIKQRKGNAHPILRVKGNLYRSIVYQADQDKAEVGSRLADDYAAIHQFGGVIDRKGGQKVLRFRKTTKGIRFAKTKHKRVQTKTVSIQNYKITMPARPYLFNSDGSIPKIWKDSLMGIVIKTLKQAFDKSV